MTMAASDDGILLVDDGELDEVAAVLDAQAISYTRLRGGQIPSEVAPPSDLLIVTPRRVERVRRGSPTGAAPGRPLRIIAVHEDSPAMRRRLRRSGLHLLVRLPADSEIWRLLIARALYRGSERREDPRVAVGSPVVVAAAGPGGADAPDTTLIDLSNRGCRLQTCAPLSVGDDIEFAIPPGHPEDIEDEMLILRGRVRRIVCDPDSDRRMLAVVFDPGMSQKTRTRLTRLINHWASGPQSLEASALAGAPPVPPCKLPSLPDLMLDDETDPPVQASSEIHVALKGEGLNPSPKPEPDERRGQNRGRFESPVRVEATREDGPLVLIGRDLSPGGMRIERNGSIHLGDRFRVALHGPNRPEPFVVEAEVTRDDGEEGFGLVFDRIDRATAAELEKIVACLPDVESLEEGEIGSLGAILSEIMTD